MPNDNLENLSRRDFLAMSSMAAASLAAGGFSSSARAQDQEPPERPKEFVNPSSKKLELLFLGTGAANWPSTYPADIKNLPRGEVRGMSSMLVNGQILIDCGPTVLEAMKCYGVSPAGVTDILLTHTHSDHLHAASVLAITNARDSASGPLRFWAHPEALKLVPESDRIEKKPVEIGKSFKRRGQSHILTYFLFRPEFWHGESIEVGICGGDLPCDEPGGSAGGDFFG